MKHKRLLSLLLALAVCVVTLTVTAYADPEETETAASEIVTPVDEKPPTPATSEAPTEDTAETVPMTEAPETETPTGSPTEPAPEETSTPEVVPPDGETNAPADVPRSRFRFTPDGQLTLIDDFEYVGMDADGNTLSKQFLTVETRDGHYFYIIIDRIGDTENVYFLNQVDAADLTVITQIEPTSSDSEYKAPTKTEPAKEMDDPIPTEEPTEPKTEPTEPNAQQSKLKAYLSLAAIVAIGAGAGVFLLIRRKKAAGQKQQLPEYDLVEDEEMEFDDDDGSAPTERLDSPQAAENEDADDEAEDETDLM